MCVGVGWSGGGAGYLCVCGDCLVMSFSRIISYTIPRKKTAQLCKDAVEDLKHSWFFSVFCPRCVQAHCVLAWGNQNQLTLLKVSENLHYERIGFFFLVHFFPFPTVSRIFQLQHMLLTTGVYICSSEDDAVFQKSVTGAGPFHQAVQVCHLYNFNTPGSTEFLISPRLVVHLGFHGFWL